MPGGFEGTDQEVWTWDKWTSHPGGGLSPTCGGEAATRAPGSGVASPPTTVAAAPALVESVVMGQAAAGKSVAGDKTEMAGEAASKQDTVRLADLAKCKVYVCFEGSLGAHLKGTLKIKKNV